MNRREGLHAVAASAASAAMAALLVARARAAAQPARPLRIGLLPDFSSGSAPLLGLFGRELAERGRVLGRDYVYLTSDMYYGGDVQLTVDRVLEQQPDLLLIMNLAYAVAARRRTRTLPMVLWVSGFPVEGGVARSLARPGGNVTGLTLYAGGEVFAKLVQLLHEAKPGMRRIGVLLSYVPPFHPQAERDLIARALDSAAAPLGVKVLIRDIAGPEDVDAALASLRAEAVEGLVLTSDGSIARRMRDVLRFAVEHRLPTIVDAPWTELGDPQPLLGYWPAFDELIRRAAPYVDKILWHGVKPGELPIELPSRFQFHVNLKTAQAIGLALPQSLLLRAERVVE